MESVSVGADFREPEQGRGIAGKQSYCTKKPGKVPHSTQGFHKKSCCVFMKKMVLWETDGELGGAAILPALQGNMRRITSNECLCRKCDRERQGQAQQ